MKRNVELNESFKKIEVTEAECHGDVGKMIKRFSKKTRKEEVLKPFYDKLLYWETKSQKARRRKQKGIYEWRKLQKNLNEEVDK